MKSLGLPAVLVTDPANVFYFSGFAGSPGDGILLITMDCAWILTDSRYTLQVKEQCPGYQILGSSALDISSLAHQLRSLGVSSLGFENKSILYSFWYRLTEHIPFVGMIALDDLFMDLRNIKDTTEIHFIAKACSIAVDALRETVPYIVPGVSEQDVALELEYRMRKKGASGCAFDTIVASGERSALPHGVASDRIIREGDAVTIDFGARFEGYCSDMTRTFFVGEPSGVLRTVYNAVYQAQLAAIQGFKVGMTSLELDSLARMTLQEMGYSEYFTHSLGHGVGIEVHEGITIGRNKTTSIQPGMIFSIEPGVYIHNVGGVRIEDLILCTEDGIVNLTDGFEKELAIL